MKDLLNRIRQGAGEARKRWKQGQGINNAVRDLTEGNVFYRNASFSDDAARSGGEQSRKLDRQIEILKQIRDQKKQGGNP